MAQIRIGTSGWYYDHWRERFYPPDLPKREFLEYLSRRLNTVEVNNTFYNLPGASTFEAWREKTPPGFLFAVKMNSYITHRKRLKEPEKPVANFFERADILKKKLGPILIQLPPSFKRDDERLGRFLKVLPKRHLYAFEFRHASWFDEEVYKLLRKHNAALCIYKLAGFNSPKETTADWVYVRLHWPGGAYQGSYSDEALRQWARDIKAWTKEGKDVFCYFDNDQRAYAVSDALRLKAMIRPPALP